MRNSKPISPLVQTKIGYSAMLLVALGAKRLGHLSFNGDEAFCDKQAIFPIAVGDGMTGTVTLWPNTVYPDLDLVDVILEVGDILIQGQLYWICGMPRPWGSYKVSHSGELPEYIMDLAYNPIPMREILA